MAIPARLPSWVRQRYDDFEEGENKKYVAYLLISHYNAKVREIQNPNFTCPLAQLSVV